MFSQSRKGRGLEVCLLATALATAAAPAAAVTAEPGGSRSDRVLQHLETTLREVAPGSAATRLGDIEVAQSLMRRAGDGRDPVDRAVALALDATRRQTLPPGLPFAPLTATGPPAAAARVAVASFLRAHGAVLAQDAARALDALPVPVSSALARVVGSFGIFERRAAALTPGVPAAGDLNAILSARAVLLHAATDLQRAVEGSAATEGGEIRIPPHLLLDLEGADSEYSSAENVTLQIDFGGDDVYLNAAGGTAGSRHFPSNVEPDPHYLDFWRKCRNELVAAALIDLSGDDRYGDGADCGRNGGAAAGAGFLFDAAGNDSYLAGSIGTNGGGGEGMYDLAPPGLGFLLDLAGDDDYVGAAYGSNGGAVSQGLGMLIDSVGSDAYTAGGSGTNGGVNMRVYYAGERASGTLIDGDGSDSYSAGANGTNGGSLLFDYLGGLHSGSGFLLDLGDGDDSYRAGDQGTNGGAYAFTYWFGLPPTPIVGHMTGFLMDEGGQDSYTGGSSGSNGGAAASSLSNIGIAPADGALIDLSGNDRYVANTLSTNGGSAIGPDGAPAGLLFDAGGADRYEDASFPNGGADDCTTTAKDGSGLLIDAPNVDCS